MSLKLLIFILILNYTKINCEYFTSTDRLTFLINSSIEIAERLDESINKYKENTNPLIKE
jgi:hypothetical protein